MTLAESAPDARMDPWCLVPVVTGGCVLFGFAVHHPATGGLSWVRSTPVEELDAAASRARTRSGRVYDLGRRFRQKEIPAEGMEAWVAYDLLMAADADVPGVVPQCGADPLLDGAWLTSCKVARHLGIAFPGRGGKEVVAFLRRHLAAYAALRSRGPLN